MTVLPGYDAWKTGGSPHQGTCEMQCSNPECEGYAQLVLAPAHIEYGIAEPLRDDCLECGGQLVSWQERLPQKCEECGHLEDACTCEEDA